VGRDEPLLYLLRGEGDLLPGIILPRCHPFDTPAVYTLLSYTEMVHDGYHNVEGGMYRIVEGLASRSGKSGDKDQLQCYHKRLRIVGQEEQGIC
jgi:hypothetical protein